MSLFKVGLLTFGGGYSMLPILERELSEKNGWISKDELLDCFAISQCIPGLIATNTATMIGYKRRGVLGALFATLGVITPSIVIIIVVAMALSDFMELEIVMNAFAGIRTAVAALIFAAVFKLFKASVMNSKKSEIKMHNIAPLGLFIIAFFVVILGASPVFVVVGAAFSGILLYGKRGDV
jgi:chromate transporter